MSPEKKRNNLKRLREIVQFLDDTSQLQHRFWDTVTDLLCIANKDKFIMVNRGFLEALGWEKREIEGHPWRPFLHPDDLLKAEQAAEELNAADLRGFTSRLRMKDGRYAKIEWNTLVWDDEGLAHSIGKLIEVNDGG